MQQTAAATAAPAVVFAITKAKWKSMIPILTGTEPEMAAATHRAGVATAPASIITRVL